MKEKIQDKINRVRALAKTPVKGGQPDERVRSSDSLSNAVRNSTEAKIFMAELDIAIRVARQR